MLSAEGYTTAAAFTFFLTMNSFSFNQRNSLGETIFYAGSATRTLFGVHNDTEPLNPDKGVIRLPGKVSGRAHYSTTATAAETHCKEPAAVAYPPEKIVHTHTSGQGDEPVIHPAFHVGDCFINTNMPRDPRVNLCGTITEQNAGIFDRMILAVMVVAAGAAFDDYTV